MIVFTITTTTTKETHICTLHMSCASRKMTHCSCLLVYVTIEANVGCIGSSDIMMGYYHFRRIYYLLLFLEKDVAYKVICKQATSGLFTRIQYMQVVLTHGHEMVP